MVIRIKGKTEYKLWCEEEGIEIKLPPSYIKEPVGGSKQAGEEVIIKSIKMCTSVNLPKNLWPKTMLTVIYLYNKSLSETHNYLLLDKRLDSWFQNYF